MTGRRNRLKAVIFILAAIVLFGGVNVVVHPAWYEWNNYDTTQGFYEQPENTIETVFLGTSVVVNGIIPAQLYDDYGICSYNLGTEQQPMLVSYYWLEEAYRLHSETLDTVVLEVSSLRRGAEDAYYRKGLETMELSTVKLCAVKNYASNFTEMLSCLIPVLSYHDRWKELSETDFEKLEGDAAAYTRGYRFVTTDLAGRIKKYTSLSLPDYTVDEQALPYELNDFSVSYLERMVDFCQEHGLRLVLFKTARFQKWTSSMHNAVQEQADKYGLTFIDFNFSPYLEELDYNSACDSVDSLHLNYYGAKKLTDWLGKYLTEECGSTDVRADERYAFLETELSDYKRSVAAAELEQIEDPYSYLSWLVEEGDYAVFVTVMGDAASALTTEERQGFSSLGLTSLAGLHTGDSYLAVLDGQTVVTEQLGENPGTYPKISTAPGRLSDTTEAEAALSLVYRGELTDGTVYKLTSGGTYTGDVSSCLIDRTEESPQEEGINIVVYDKLLGKVVDATCFATGTSSSRSPGNPQTELDELEAGEKTYEELSETAQLVYQFIQACEARKAELGIS